MSGHNNNDISHTSAAVVASAAAAAANQSVATSDVSTTLLTHKMKERLALTRNLRILKRRVVLEHLYGQQQVSPTPSNSSETAATETNPDRQLRVSLHAPPLTESTSRPTYTRLLVSRTHSNFSSSVSSCSSLSNDSSFESDDEEGAAPSSKD